MSHELTLSLTLWSSPDLPFDIAKYMGLSHDTKKMRLSNARDLAFTGPPRLAKSSHTSSSRRHDEEANLAGTRFESRHARIATQRRES